VRFICSSCNRVLEVERFKVEGSTLVVVCTSCGAENISHAVAQTALAAHGSHGVPPAAPIAAAPLANVVALRTPTVEAIARAAKSVAEKPFDVPPGHCPKCISRRAPNVLACPSCGLTFSTAKENAFAPSTWLESEWLTLLKSWGDDA
jgi:ribosomal protein L37AE/L43A